MFFCAGKDGSCPGNLQTLGSKWEPEWGQLPESLKSRRCMHWSQPPRGPVPLHFLNWDVVPVKMAGTTCSHLLEGPPAPRSESKSEFSLINYFVLSPT